MNRVVVGKDVIPFSITYSPKARKKRIVIAPSGVRVVLPHGSQEREATELIESLKHRVHRAMEKVLQQDERLKSFTDIHYVSGTKIPFLGNELPLLVYQERRKRSRLEYDGRLIVRVPVGLTSQRMNAEVKRKVEGWIKKEMHGEALKSASFFERKLGILPREIRIKAQKKLWGSCGRNHVINLNWKLALFPRKAFDYVVAHEMCHLRHLNHSKAFWKLLSSLMPGYQEQREWLKFRGHGFQ